MIKRPKFVNDEIYHIYNRGVEKRKIFLDDKDRFRFIHNLFEFNNQDSANKFYIPVKFSEIRLPKIELEKKKRKLMVEILVFCLMDNHYHLLLRQRATNGITEFMRKLGTGYTNYFNLKYKRVGPLFQGKFKAIIITEQRHFLYIPYYIHLNPLDYIAPEWRDGKIKNYKKALELLENYRWSSHLDYIGKKNFPSVTQRNFLLKYFDGEKEFKNNFSEWLKELNLDDINNLTLE